MRLAPACLAVALALTGCGSSFGSTVLPTARATGGVAPEYHIQIPDGYDVQSVDYDASYVGLAGGNSGTVTTEIAGRGVVAVYAVRTATGERVVLVYDDIEGRVTPSAVIHLDRAAP